MTPATPESGFGGYLKEAIQAARFPTPTHFARAAGTDPSVVLRWLSGEQRPTIRSIERIAPVLGLSINEIVVAAYPDRVGGPQPQPPATHPLVHELGRILAPDSRCPRRTGPRWRRCSTACSTRTARCCAAGVPPETRPVSLLGSDVRNLGP